MHLMLSGAARAASSEIAERQSTRFLDDDDTSVRSNQNSASERRKGSRSLAPRSLICACPELLLCKPCRQVVRVVCSNGERCERCERWSRAVLLRYPSAEFQRQPSAAQVNTYRVTEAILFARAVKFRCHVLRHQGKVNMTPCLVKTILLALLFKTAIKALTDINCTIWKQKKPVALVVCIMGVVVFCCCFFTCPAAPPTLEKSR